MTKEAPGIAVVLVALTLSTALIHAEPTRVKVGYLPATHDALLFLAKELNLFGPSIAVEVIPYDNSVQILSDLKSNIIDIGIPGLATPATEIGGRAPLTIIGGAASRSAALVAQKALADAMAKAASPEGKAQLLRSRRVGAVRGSTGLAIFRQLLVRAKLSEKDVDLTHFSKPSEIISALAAGDLDAGLLWSPHMTLAEARGLPTVLWMSDVLPNHVCCRQVARDAFLAQREAAVDYLLGILRADKLLREARKYPERKPRLLAAVRRYLSTLTDAQLEVELFDSNPRTAVSPELDRRGIAAYLDAMQTAGLMRQDQCSNVEQKVKGEFLQGAYQKLGCNADVARACVEKPASECECAQPR